MVAATQRTLRMSSTEIREKLGLSRVAWARALNVSAQAVNNWEHHGHEPKGLSSEVLNGIATALESTPPELHAALGMRVTRLGIGALLTAGLCDVDVDHPDNVRLDDVELALLIPSLEAFDDATEPLRDTALALAKKLRRVRIGRVSRAKTARST